jgi:hypothetical protein
MHYPNRSSQDDFHLFHREKRALRGGVILLATLLGLAVAAFALPRVETAVTWATDLVATLLA